MGHVGRDAEVNETKNGRKVAKFSLATTNKYKSGDEWKETTTWHNIVVWSPRDEIQQFTKGALVYVEGRIETRSYEDKNGVKQTVTEIVADRVAFLRDKHASGPPQRSAPRQRQAEPEQEWTGATDDMVPF